MRSYGRYMLSFVRNREAAFQSESIAQVLPLCHVLINLTFCHICVRVSYHSFTQHFLIAIDVVLLKSFITFHIFPFMKFFSHVKNEVAHFLTMGFENSMYYS